MRIAVIIGVLAALGLGGWQVAVWRNRPMEVFFYEATRGPISAEISTNGKVEPKESAEAHAESSGRVNRVLVQLGQKVQMGDPLVELDTSLLEQEKKAIATKIQGVRDQLKALDSDASRAQDRAALQAELATAKVKLAHAQSQYDTDLGLLNHKSGPLITRDVVEQDKRAVDEINSQIEGVNKRLAALAEYRPDRSPLESQIKGYETDREGVEQRIRQATVRAPIAGTIYKFDLKEGAYLNPGDTVASIGQLSKVLVTVFVDEPDLGPVKMGLPVTITWDAMPGRTWKGKVNQLPTQIQALDSRQVGQVMCTIDNPDQDLKPGANATVRITKDAVKDAISIPKDAVIAKDGKTGVFVLVGDHIEWRPVTEGVSNVTRVQVNELKEGDRVAQPPAGRALTDHMAVRVAAAQ